MNRHLGIAAAAFVCVLASGCASITGSQAQSIALETLDSSGQFIEGECRLSNDKGSWVAKSPGHVLVGRSGADMSVQCTAPGQQPGTATAISRANDAMGGNIIFGGVVGALIDNTGAGYDYPSLIRVVFGSVRIVDRRDEPPGGWPSAAPRANPHPVATPSSPAPQQPGASVTPAKATMEDLGNLLPAK